jgi:hypothetical protein
MFLQYLLNARLYLLASPTSRYSNASSSPPLSQLPLQLTRPLANLLRIMTNAVKQPYQGLQMQLPPKNVKIKKNSQLVITSPDPSVERLKV